MMIKEIPKPDDNGWYEPVIGPAPENWPWAIPHIFALNLAFEPELQETGASASPDGSAEVDYVLNEGRTRIETIGFWRGEFGVLHVGHERSMQAAEIEAETEFFGLPIRYLMRCGKVFRKNETIEITGEWPDDWKFLRVCDLGIFCAYVHELATAAGAKVEADAFRSAITYATPLTEQLLVYESALKSARGSLRPWLNKRTLETLGHALRTVDKWIRRS